MTEISSILAECSNDDRYPRRSVGAGSRSQYMNSKTCIKNRGKWQLHTSDVGSSAVQIVQLTARVAYLTEHLVANKKDRAAKRGLTQIVSTRRKLLNYLYKKDPIHTKRMATDLGIRFRPAGTTWNKALVYGAFKNTKRS